MMLLSHALIPQDLCLSMIYSFALEYPWISGISILEPYLKRHALGFRYLCFKMPIHSACWTVNTSKSSKLILFIYVLHCSIFLYWIKYLVLPTVALFQTGSKLIKMFIILNNVIKHFKIERDLQSKPWQIMSLSSLWKITVTYARHWENIKILPLCYNSLSLK